MISPLTSSTTRPIQFSAAAPKATPVQTEAPAAQATEASKGSMVKKLLAPLVLGLALLTPSTAPASFSPAINPVNPANPGSPLHHSRRPVQLSENDKKMLDRIMTGFFAAIGTVTIGGLGWIALDALKQGKKKD